MRRQIVKKIKSSLVIAGFSVCIIGCGGGGSSSSDIASSSLLVITNSTSSSTASSASTAAEMVSLQALSQVPINGEVMPVP